MGSPGTRDVSTRPLGVLDDVELSDQQLRALRALEAYDLSRVRHRLVSRGIMPSSWVDEALQEFRRYLGLRLLAPGPLTMFSHPVDEVWHTALLFSRLYAEYCQQAFGHFLHHEPEDDPPDSGDVGHQWQEFVTTYERVYGPLTRLWRMGQPS